MTTGVQQKKGNLPVRSSHLHLVPLERTPEQKLDLELSEEVAALEVPDGPRPKRFYKIADGELFPVRVLARVLNDALHAEVDPVALWHAVIGPIRRFIERKARRRLPPPPPGRFLPGA